MVVVCGIPILLWAAIPVPGRFATAQAAVASLGTLAGLAAFATFATNLMLGSRLGPLDRLFGGLDKLFVYHRRIGLIAFALVAVHAGLMLASQALISWSALAGLFVPSHGYVYIVGAIAFCGLAAGVVVTLFARIDHETFVYVQRAFGFVFIVAALHAFRVPGAKASSHALTWYLGALTIVAVAAFLYRPLLGYALSRRHPYRVRSVRLVGPDVTEVVMEPHDLPIRFTPGQFVYVTFDPSAMGRAGRVVRTKGGGRPSRSTSIRAKRHIRCTPSPSRPRPGKGICGSWPRRWGTTRGRCAA